MQATRLTLPAIFIIFGSSVTGAQSRSPVPSAPTRIAVAGHLLLAQPKGEFGSNVGNGFGGNFVFIYKLDESGVFSVRADLGGMQYGSEKKRVPFIPFTGRVLLDVTTTNDVYWAGAGPQVQLLARGPVRPYVNAAVGIQGFVTRSALSGTDNYRDYASTTNSNDAALAWMLGGGVCIPFGRTATAASLDIGARYHFGGTASYLREGDITDNSDGTITLHPRSSRTDMIIWQAGVSLPIPGRR